MDLGEESRNNLQCNLLSKNKRLPHYKIQIAHNLEDIKNHNLVELLVEYHNNSRSTPLRRYNYLGLNNFRARIHQLDIYHHRLEYQLDRNYLQSIQLNNYNNLDKDNLHDWNRLMKYL